VEDHTTGKKEVRRVPLMDKDGVAPVHTVPAARDALRRLQVSREAGTLPVVKQTPKFGSYRDRFGQHIEVQGDLRPATVQKLKASLRLWGDDLDEVRIDKIKRVHVIRGVERFTEAGASARTANLHVIALRRCLKLALEEGLIVELPMQGVRPLKTTDRKRSLVTLEGINAICVSAASPAFVGGRLAREGEQGKPLKNALQFGDYVRLMAFCGSRRDETLRLRWKDVDFERRQITIGAEGDSKNRRPRVVDFNPDLERHLKDMHRRKAPDTEWLFPSPQRGERDIPAKSLKESVWLARSHAAKTKPELANFQLHDCRHTFISTCVMAGIDFMTIAAWVGHRDGGVLIGKVYGHLANEHRKAMADKLRFTPTIVEKTEEAV
jgi:integrase